METTLPNSDQDFVESLIPQRFPFVMVGEVSDYSENLVVSRFTIKEDHIFVSEGIFQASGLI